MGAKVYMNSPVLNIDYDKKEVTALVDGKEHVESVRRQDKIIILPIERERRCRIRSKCFGLGSKRPKRWFGSLNPVLRITKRHLRNKASRIYI